MRLQDEKSRFLIILKLMNLENKQTTKKDINDFIISLNDESNRNSIVIVEGKKDVEALYFVGFKGNIKAYHHFRGTTNFIDQCSLRYNKVILLLDSDRKGSFITKKILSQSNGKTIDLKYKKKLQKITRGRIKKIEEIKSFYQFLSEK
jgi:5S rRNA maturation endonuclease (ribonuclease M5)